MGRLRILLTGAAALLAAADGWGADTFSLGLDQVQWPPADPRTLARRAQWNSPMGRLMYEFSQQQAALYQPGTPGGAQGMAVGVAFQSGRSPRVVASMMNAGVQLYEQQVLVIAWPWDEDGDTVGARPIDEQISVLLGRRIELR